MADELTGADVQTAESTALALRARDVTKSFNGNVVLRDFNLDLEPGKVHALLGHNGSGKSTFIKILSGYYVPDAGSVEVEGEQLRLGDPVSSAKSGLSFVHQSLGLVPQLSVVENLRLGKTYDTSVAGKINWRRERAATRAALAQFELNLDPDAPVGRLTVVEQTLLAIVRALSNDGGIRVLVLDEPTAAVTEHEVAKLFRVISAIKARRVAVVYVSHRLEEVQRIADHVTVLRDGRTVGSGPVAEFSPSRLVSLISGPQLEAENAAITPPQPQREGATATLLSIDGLSAGALRDFNFSGQGGEIVGVVGLLGSGIEELAAVLGGQLGAVGGAVHFRGERVKPARLARLVQNGFGVVMGERSERLMLPMSIQENVTLPVLHRLFRNGALSRRLIRRTSERAMTEFKVRPPIGSSIAATLSGGNQQKVALARVMQTDPVVLVLDEPFRGVDALGRAEITLMLRTSVSKGRLVLIIDSDLDQIVELCSRVIVLRGGHTQAEFVGTGIQKTSLLEACYGRSG